MKTWHITTVIVVVIVAVIVMGAGTGIALLARSYRRDISSIHRTLCYVTKCNLTTRYCGNGYGRYSTYSYTCIDMELDFYYRHRAEQFDRHNYTTTVKVVGSELLVGSPTCSQMMNYRNNNTLRCWFDERNHVSSLQFHPYRDIGGRQISGMILLSLLISVACVGVPVCILVSNYVGVGRCESPGERRDRGPGDGHPSLLQPT